MSPSEQYRDFGKKGLPWGVVALVVVLATISMWVGLVNGVRHPTDFQWSGTRVLLHHVDPWAEYLHGDPQHQFVLFQVPNYLPMLYIVLAPLGLMPMVTASLVWDFCNLGFCLGIALLAGRFYGFRGRPLLGVICLMLMSTQMRNSMGNGQQNLLVLLIWCATLLSPQLTRWKALASGLSFLKFTFAPAAALYLLFRWGWRAVLWSAVPMLVGTGLVWIWLTGGHDPHALLRLAAEPLEVARRGYLPRAGGQNLMDALDPLLISRMSLAWADLVEAGCALVVCTAISWLAFSRHRDVPVQWQMAVMATMSFMIFRHHNYDGIMLLLPFAYAASRWREGHAQVVLSVLAYLFYGQRVLEAAHLHGRNTYPFEYVLLTVMLVSIYRLGVPSAGRELALRPQLAVSR